MILSFEDYINEGLFGGTGIKFDHYRSHGYYEHGSNPGLDSLAFILLGNADKSKIQTWKEVEKALAKYIKKLDGNYKLTDMFVSKDNKKTLSAYFGGDDQMKKALNSCRFRDFKYVKSLESETNDMDLQGNYDKKRFTIKSTYGPGIKLIIDDPNINDELEIDFTLEEVKQERYRN